MDKRLVASSVVLLMGLGGVPASQAREPEAASWTVLEAAREGTFLPGRTPGGDTRALIGLFPQMTLWIGFTLVTGMLVGSITAAILRGRRREPVATAA